MAIIEIEHEKVSDNLLIWCETLSLIVIVSVVLNKPSIRLHGRPWKNRQALIISAPRFEANERMIC